MLRYAGKSSSPGPLSATCRCATVSFRTHALLVGSQVCPFVRGTLIARTTGWTLPVQGRGNRPLRDFVEAFVEALLFLTDLAVPLDDLCVAPARGVSDSRAVNELRTEERTASDPEISAVSTLRLTSNR